MANIAKVLTEEQGKDDRSLVADSKAGKEKAFDELILRHASKLYQMTAGLLRNQQDAEEVVQDAFVKAHRAIREFRGDASFETWIRRIAMNLARNKYMWNKRRGLNVNLSISGTDVPPDAGEDIEELTIPDGGPGPDKILENEEMQAIIEGAFEKLPDTLREAMVLRHLSEMSYEEIAALLECRVGTVKSRISRGRELLREIIENDSVGMGKKQETLRKQE